MSAECHDCGTDLYYDGTCPRCSVVAQRDQALKERDRLAGALREILTKRVIYRYDGPLPAPCEQPRPLNAGECRDIARLALAASIEQGGER